MPLLSRSSSAKDMRDKIGFVIDKKDCGNDVFGTPPPQILCRLRSRSMKNGFRLSAYLTHSACTRHWRTVVFVNIPSYLEKRILERTRLSIDVEVDEIGTYSNFIKKDLEINHKEKNNAAEKYTRVKSRWCISIIFGFKATKKSASVFFFLYSLFAQYKRENCLYLYPVLPCMTNPTQILLIFPSSKYDIFFRWISLQQFRFEFSRFLAMFFRAKINSILSVNFHQSIHSQRVPIHQCTSLCEKKAQSMLLEQKNKPECASWRFYKSADRQVCTDARRERVRQL